MVKPEEVKSIELGYRGKLSRNFSVDMSVYKNEYSNFINTQVVLTPYYGSVGDGALSVLAIANGDFETWSVYTNSSAEINSWGGAIGINTKILGFDVSGNYTKSVLDLTKKLILILLLTGIHQSTSLKVRLEKLNFSKTLDSM